MNETELDLDAMKAHRDAVAPMLMRDPSSVMYQVAITNTGLLIQEVERLRKKCESSPENYSPRPPDSFLIHRDIVEGDCQGRVFVRLWHFLRGGRNDRTAI